MWPRAKLRLPSTTLGIAFFPEQLVSVNRHILPARASKFVIPIMLAGNCPRAHNHRVRSHCFTGIFFSFKVVLWEAHHLFCTPVSCLSLIIASDIYGKKKKIQLKVYNCLFKICELTNPQNIKSSLRRYRHIFQITKVSLTLQLGNIKEQALAILDSYLVKLWDALTRSRMTALP